MYGSCATQLDLPSSDLDLVVCGLDNVNLSIHPSEQTTTSCQNSPRSIHNEEESQQEHVDAMHIESMTPDQQTGDLSEVEQEVQYEEVDEDVVMENYEPDYHMVNQQDYYYVPQNYYPPVSLNAQRVMRLASELEQQPWAVQVKAIPTATVPVVKMLADPSRLPGAAASGGNWMMQQHIGTQAGTPPVSSEQLPSSPNQLFSQNKSSMSSSPHYFSPPSLPMWRGADIMNGLQPVDITFEGPEHGGIGSTTYSTAVVQDSCDETGLPPDSTPIVQVAMVLKELLAQRRLNEPFSGGLSSYALLLLLLAVVKDRKIIQNEMEKIEKQRQKVNGSDSREVSQSSKTAGTLQKHYTSTTPLTAAQVVAGKSAFPKMKGNSKEVSSSGGVESAENANINASKPTPASSWASIAKKSNSSTAKTDSTSTLKSNTSSGTTLTTKTGANSSKAVTSNMELCNSGNAETILPNNDLTTTLPTTESHPFDKSQTVSQNKKSNPEGPAAVSQVTPPSEDGNKTGESLAPQGSNDVFDVLCSGELTSGKLLMHFLLFYGQHFDAQNTLIDITASHHSEYGRRAIQNLSPFVARPPGGNIDPVTGMFSVDPIVVYDPLEGAMDHNVAKRCYCWNNVRWVFAQCYMTVSSIVETSGSSTKNSSQAMHNRSAKPADDSHVEGSNVAVATAEKPGPSSDALNPILELLLSF